MVDEYGRRDLSDVMPNHINEEAVIFRGCTTTEITIITAISAVFWITVTAIIGSMMDMFYPILGTSILLVLITVFIISTIFQSVKRGQAPGHYHHLVELFLSKIHMKKTPFVTHDGEFSLGRTKQIVLMKRHLGVVDEDE